MDPQVSHNHNIGYVQVQFKRIDPLRPSGNYMNHLL
jgi:hypothetical protein